MTTLPTEENIVHIFVSYVVLAVSQHSKEMLWSQMSIINWFDCSEMF